MQNMASKVPKFLTKPKAPSVISAPSNFKHVIHYDGKDRPDTSNNPSSNQSHDKTQADETNGLPDTITLTDGKSTVKSELSRLLREELEPIRDELKPIKQCLENVLTHLNVANDMGDCKTEKANTDCTSMKDIKQCCSAKKSEVRSKETGETSHEEINDEPRCKCKSVERSVCRQGWPSFTNPTYGKRENDSIIKGERQAQATSMMNSGFSETRVKKTSSANPPWNEPVGETSVPTVAKTPVPLPRGFKRPAASERGCLADAIQTYVEDIVGHVIFKESELPDELTADGCITEDESFAVMELKNRKDQIRVLVSLIHGRDLHVLKNFVKRIKQMSKEVADKINARFEENKRVLVKTAMCACCEMKTHVNIKSVSDGLWSIGAISDGLYSEIAHLDKPSGAQNDLWIRLIDSINNIREKEQRGKAYTKLVRALGGKNHYSYIAESTESMISRNKSIACKCKIQCVRTSLGSSHDTSSFYPESSTKSSTFGSFNSSGKLSETEVKEVFETVKCVCD